MKIPQGKIRQKSDQLLAQVHQYVRLRRARRAHSQHAHANSSSRAAHTTPPPPPRARRAFHLSSEAAAASPAASAGSSPLLAMVTTLEGAPLPDPSASTL